MFKQLSFALAVSAASCAAQSAVLTFTDRAAFQAAATGYSLDNLNNVGDGSQITRDRGAYTIDFTSFGCSSGVGQCGNNSAQGFTYPAYLSTFGSGNFVFASAINAFGLDFGMAGSESATVTLNGKSYSHLNGGFFGIIDTSAAFKIVSYVAASGALIDNITYRTQLPEPAPLALFGIALAGFGVLRRRAR